MRRVFIIGLALFWALCPTRAAMTLPATDNFTRANSGSLGANWTEQIHGLQISSNHATPVVSLTYQFVFWNADVFNNDQYSELTISNFDGSAGQDGPTVRASGTAGSAQNYFMLCDLPNGRTQFYYYHGGTFTQIGTNITTAWANGDIAHLEVSGTTFTLKRNGTTIGTETDSNIGSGSAGFELRNPTNDTASLWTGGNVGGGGSTAPCRLASLGVGCDEATARRSSPRAR